MITDLDSERSIVRQLRIASQRPRRFLKSSVKYDTSRQQIEIVVEPRDRSRLPASAVKVAASLIDTTSGLPVGRLESEITGPDYRARMLAGAAPDPDKVVDVLIHVDGYPRAFTFHVPCFDEQDRLLEDLETASVRVLSPKSGQSYRTPLDSISAVLQVDAPNSAFQLPDDVIQVGLDRDNDRDFRDEPCVYLHSDRQVVVKELSFAPDGKMSVKMGVTDFRLQLPKLTSTPSINSSVWLARAKVIPPTLQPMSKRGPRGTGPHNSRPRRSTANDAPGVWAERASSGSWLP